MLTEYMNIIHLLAEAAKSVRPDLAQARVVQSKVVRELVSQDVMDHAPHFLGRAATHFDGPAVDADLVRQDQPIVVGALRLGHAVVRVQEHSWVADASLPQRPPIRPFLDYDLDVVQFILELLGQLAEGLSNELFKGLPVHIRVL